MSRNESIVEDAALEGFGEPGKRISKFALHPDLYLMPRFLGKKNLPMWQAVRRIRGISEKSPE